MTYGTKGIKSSDAFRSLDETELDGVAVGRMKLPRPDPMPAPSGGGAGEPLEATPWSSNPIYLGPF
jgi:hypothetical protein